MTKIVTNRSIVNNAYYLQKGDLKVIYLPMIHLSKTENYAEVKKFIEEKRKAGYRVYYEKLIYFKDSAGFEELSLKMRRLTGLTFGQKYLSEEQKDFRENVNKEKYSWQSTVDYGVDFKNDIHADYTLKELINVYEELNGKVQLDSCDYNSPMDKSYDCTRPSKYQEVVHDLRNAKLVNHLLDTIHKKKLVVYGMGHYYAPNGVFINLYHRNNFEEVKSKNWLD